MNAPEIIAAGGDIQEKVGWKGTFVQILYAGQMEPSKVYIRVLK